MPLNEPYSVTRQAPIFQVGLLDSLYEPTRYDAGAMRTTPRPGFGAEAVSLAL